MRYPRVSFEQGACPGIPGIAAHCCVHAAGPVDGRAVLIQGGAGAVGLCAVQPARRAGGRVIATVCSAQAEGIALRAGAREVVRTDGVTAAEVVARIRGLAPDGVKHIVEVAFGENIAIDEKVLAVGGSLAAYATGESQPRIPFWELLFKNVRMYFLGSDDFTAERKGDAAKDVNAALEAGWPGFEVIHRFSLSEIAAAHEAVEGKEVGGRVIVML